MKFSVPFNGDVSIIQYYIDNKNKISDMYFGLPDDILPSGRLTSYNESSEKYLKNLMSALVILKKNNIATSLLINLSCEGKDTFSQKLIDKYKKLIAGFNAKGLIKNVVLFNPAYVCDLKNEFPRLKFTISVNSGINTLCRAKEIDRMSFDTIILDRDINHNVALIKNISSDVSAEIKLLVNECCLNECIYRQAHFNLLSHPAKDIDYKERIPCINIVCNNPWKILKSSFLLPSELKKYAEFVRVFKIAGRTLPTKLLKISLDAYFNEISEGNLLPLLSSYGIFNWKAKVVRENNKIPSFEISKLPVDFREVISKCQYDCNSCGYCERVWNNCVSYTKIIPGKLSKIS